MTEPPEIKRRVAVTLIGWFLRTIGCTYRTTTIVGGGVLERVVAGERPVIFSFWHENIT